MKIQIDVSKWDVEGAQAAHPAVIHKMLSSVSVLSDKKQTCATVTSSRENLNYDFLLYFLKHREH